MRMEDGRRRKRRKSGKGRRQEEQDGREEITKGKRAPADEGKEASKRQANLQKGRHQKLYRKAGFMV